MVLLFWENNLTGFCVSDCLFLFFVFPLQGFFGQMGQGCTNQNNPEHTQRETRQIVFVRFNQKRRNPFSYEGVRNIFVLQFICFFFFDYWSSALFFKVHFFYESPSFYFWLIQFRLGQVEQTARTPFWFQPANNLKHISISFII